MLPMCGPQYRLSIRHAQLMLFMPIFARSVSTTQCSVLSIHRSHLSFKNSLKTPHISLWGSEVWTVILECKIWSKFYLGYCYAVPSIVLQMIAIYRELIVLPKSWHIHPTATFLVFSDRASKFLFATKVFIWLSSKLSCIIHRVLFPPNALSWSPRSQSSPALLLNEQFSCQPLQNWSDWVLYLFDACYGDIHRLKQC